jgi:hypothetical protein
LAAWWCRWRGIVVLVETSPYDIFIKYHMPEFPWSSAFARHFCLARTFVLSLRADPRSIVARKAELTVGEISDFYDRVDRVIRRAGTQSRTVAVPTDVSPDRSFTLAAAEVIHQIGLARVGAQPMPLLWHDR